MDITFPETRRPQYGSSQENPTASFGQTANAQWGNLLGPAFDGLKYFTGEGGGSKGFDRVEQYISKNGLEGEDARYLRTYGIGTDGDFESALRQISLRRVRNETIQRSTGLNLMFSHPTVPFDIAFAFSGIAAANVINVLRGRTILSGMNIGKSVTSGVKIAKTTDVPRAMVGNQGWLTSKQRSAYWSQRPTSAGAFAYAQNSPADVARLTAFAGMASETVSQAFELGNEAQLNDLELQEMRDSALSITATGAIGALLGYGVTKAVTGGISKPLRKAERAKIFSNGYQEYLNAVRSAVDGEKPASEASFMGTWFQNSLFSKMFPTPLKTELNDSSIPDAAKWELLALMGDAGTPLIANGMGKTVDQSVYMAAAARDGDWFKALSVVDDAYAEVAPRGNATFLNIPVGDYVESGLKRVGKNDAMPKSDWYERIGRLMIDEVDYKDMTPQEARSVQAVREFYSKYEMDLNETGLIRSSEIMFQKEERLGEMIDGMVSFSEQMFTTNRNFLEKSRDRIATSYAKAEATLASLIKTQETRGLTKKQADLVETLKERMDVLSDASVKVQDMYDTLSKADITADDLDALFERVQFTDKQKNALRNVQSGIEKVSSILDGVKEITDFYRRKRDVSPRNYFTRVWNRRAIEADRDGLVKKIAKYYQQNNEYIALDSKGKPVLKRLPSDYESALKRANQTVDNIMGLADDDIDEMLYAGATRTGPLLSRTLDIPNSVVRDYIVQDVKELMISYTSRAAPRIEFQRRAKLINPVENRPATKPVTLREKLDDLRKTLKDAGTPPETIDRFIKNYKASYDMIVGRAIKEPDRLDTKTAEWLRMLTSWTYLKSAGVAAIADASAIFMDHELKAIGRAFLGSLDDIDLSLAKKELNLAGGALEISKGSSHLRYLESLTNDGISKSAPDKINNFFYGIGNMLGPITVFFKTFEGVLRSHSLIDYSRKVVDGTANDFERTFLAQYGINEDIAKAITESPYEVSNSGLYLPNTEAWTNELAVEKFRVALNSGVMNRIIMASPADKPLPMSGFTYIPEKYARHIPMDLSADPLVPGYRRVESGLMTLPFTFYSYTMGALNKITGNYAAGAVRNKLAHFGFAMMLGGLVVKVRTPSWAWEEMDTEDKVARAFDFSGLAAIYSDLTYRTIGMAAELGFENVGPIQPKFNSGTDPLSAFASLGGAPADWSLSSARALKEFVAGDMSEGAKDIVRMLPLVDALAFGGVLKGTLDDMAASLPSNE